MASYVASNQNGGTPQNLSSSYKSIVGIVAQTGATLLRRGWIMEWEIGADNVPNATDCPISWSIDVSTSLGTATNITTVVNPNDIGGGDAAALLLYQANYTVEPTVTANSNVWYMGLNQRASYRIQMRDEVSAIIVPAVNQKGPVFRAKSPNYASTVGVRALVKE
jgi:hypothetical protein